VRIQFIPVLLILYFYKIRDVLLNSKGFYYSYKGFFIVDFGIRLILFDFKVLGIVKTRNREIILFNKGINRERKARMRRFYFLKRFLSSVDLFFVANFLFFVFSRLAFF
jgi:hypothetical protein